MVYSSFSRDEEKGWIHEDGERIVSLKAKTFQAFVNRLVSVVGARIADAALYQMGNEIGHITFNHRKDEIKSNGDLRKVYDKAAVLRGWGRCLSLEQQNRDGKIVYVFKLSGTPFSYERASTEPTCYIQRGLTAGYLEGYLDKKAESAIETACASMGAQCCVFEVAFIQ